MKIEHEEIINVKKFRRDVSLFTAFVQLCLMVDIITRGRFSRWNQRTHFLEDLSDIWFDIRSKHWVNKKYGNASGK